MAVKKYRVKNTIVDAVFCTPETLPQAVELAGGDCAMVREPGFLPRQFAIRSLLDLWITKQANGTVEILSPEAFADKYDLVDQENAFCLYFSQREVQILRRAIDCFKELCIARMEE